jgi:hypothetical protein
MRIPKRGGGCATLIVAAVVGGLALATPAWAEDDGCPAGQTADGFTGECVLDIAPISFVDGPTAQSIIIGGDNYGSVNGIPCTPEHLGTCIGMSYNQPSHTQPRSTISHSP